MEIVEYLVLVLDLPGLGVEIDLDHVLSVGLLIDGVLFDQGLRDVDADGDLEEVGPVAVPVILVTGFYVGEEHLGGVKDLAELALDALTVLEDSRVDLDLGKLLVETLVLILDLGDSLTQGLVGVHDLHLLLLLHAVLLFLLVLQLILLALVDS